MLLTQTQRPYTVSVVSNLPNVSLIRSQRAGAATIVSDPVQALFPREVLRSLCLLEANGKRARGKSVTFTISTLDSDDEDARNSDEDGGQHETKGEPRMSSSFNGQAICSDGEGGTHMNGGVDGPALSAEPTNNRYIKR